MLKGTFVLPNDISSKETPRKFSTRNDESWFDGGYTALSIIHLANLEYISYACENGGELFINIVPFDAQSGVEPRKIEKSENELRGHTDGCSFPFEDELHLINEGLPLAPDFILLIGYKNPQSTPTYIIPLSTIIEQLNPSIVEELKKPIYDIGNQRTFNINQQLVEVPLIANYRSNDEYQIRYSHSSVAGPEDNPAAGAIQQLDLAITQCKIPVVIEPGDILLINNRTALHGRGKVGERNNQLEHENRWIQRIYASTKRTNKNIIPFMLGPQIQDEFTGNIEEFILK
ncbi:MAG: hypothetical protein EA365_10480 [Gloeocapsa sp. DLM2.Bin57]|nr:MAG: hypothetical protein EA365_10480 [Gloeocapsa sp. DLM2.Bin57]